LLLDARITNPHESGILISENYQFHLSVLFFVPYSKLSEILSPKFLKHHKISIYYTLLQSLMIFILISFYLSY